MLAGIVSAQPWFSVERVHLSLELNASGRVDAFYRCLIVPTPEAGALSAEAELNLVLPQQFSKVLEFRDLSELLYHEHWGIQVSDSYRAEAGAVAIDHANPLHLLDVKLASFEQAAAVSLKFEELRNPSWLFIWLKCADVFRSKRRLFESGRSVSLTIPVFELDDSTRSYLHQSRLADRLKPVSVLKLWIGVPRDWKLATLFPGPDKRYTREFELFDRLGTETRFVRLEAPMARRHVFVWTQREESMGC